MILVSNFQTLSESVAPTRSYRYTNLTGSLSSMMSFTGDMFEIALPGVDGGHVVNVTVLFERGPCTSAAIASSTGEGCCLCILSHFYIAVPGRNITGITLNQNQTTDTSQPTTITLPLTQYQPEELLIISTVEPSNGNTIMANFSGPGMQLSVTFDNLMADTFKISIVSGSCSSRYRL